MKQVLVIMMVGALLLLSGCAGGGTATTAYDPFIGGDTGLTMEYITGSPPDEVFDNGQYAFSVSVKLDNTGEADVEEGAGFLEIKGISAEEFGVSPSALRVDIPELPGARKGGDGSVIAGQTDVVTFDDLEYQQDLAGNLAISNFRVRACYDYDTEASSQLCIKEKNVDGLKANEVCLINELKGVANTGAPIQIVNVAETAKGSNGVQISFDVAHVGPADFRWFPHGDNECNDRIDNKDMYKVEVEVDPIVNGKYSAKCSGGSFDGGNKGTVTMFNGASRKVICSFDVGTQESDFETRVNIKLKYRYLQYIEKQLVIKDLGTDE